MLTVHLSSLNFYAELLGQDTRNVYVCINLYNDCPINRGPDQ